MPPINRLSLIHIFLFPRLLKVLETGMLPGVIDGHGQYLFRDQAYEAFMERHAQCTDTSWVEAKGGSQDEVRSIGLKQIG